MITKNNFLGLLLLVILYNLILFMKSTGAEFGDLLNDAIIVTHDIHATACSNAYAVGIDATTNDALILKFNGGTWSRLSGHGFSKSAIPCIYRTSPDGRTILNSIL